MCKPKPPVNLHPTIKFIHAELKRRRVTVRKFSNIVGVANGTLSHWFTKGRSPLLFQWFDVLDALGYEVIVVPKGTTQRLTHDK